MRFYLNGKPIIVVVDDYLPIDKRKGRPAFAHSKSKGEFWMCILEKAWAKLHGCYSLIESGRAENVFSHLTNAPT